MSAEEAGREGAQAVARGIALALRIRLGGYGADNEAWLIEAIAAALNEADGGMHSYRGTAVSCEEYERMQKAKRDALAATLTQQAAEIERWASQQVYRDQALEITTLAATLTRVEGALRRLMDYQIRGGGEYGGEGYTCGACGEEAERLENIPHDPACAWLQGHTALLASPRAAGAP